MKMKVKMQVRHDWFIPWILEEYDSCDIRDAWSSGETIEDFCMGIAGLLPIDHIWNWDDIKNHFDDEPYNRSEINPETGKLYASWTEYFEEDGYIHDPFFDLPETIEVEWVNDNGEVVAT